MWNPGQRTPATAWETEIDRLMREVATSLDPARRKESFAAVQHIVAREVPVLCFAFPRFTVAVSSRVANPTPAPFRPPILWNADAIGVRSVETP